jgi:hypothetical protein
MPIPRLVITLFFAAGCPFWAQNLTTSQQRLADLNFVATTLPALDPFFFNQLKPADFNAAVSQLSAQVVTLSDAQFYVGLTALVAMAGDPQAPVEVLIGETPAAVLYSAPVLQIAGLWQINARTPQTVSGQTVLFLIAGNTAGNGVTIWLK